MRRHEGNDVGPLVVMGAITRCDRRPQQGTDPFGRHVDLFMGLGESMGLINDELNVG